MSDKEKRPITHWEWAEFEIKGQLHSPTQGVGKDIMVDTKGEVSAWYERSGHKLKPEMVERALKLKPEVLIIGNGWNGALKVGKKVGKAAAEAGVKELMVLITPEACKSYNRLYSAGRQVVLLAHGTC